MRFQSRRHPATITFAFALVPFRRRAAARTALTLCNPLITSRRFFAPRGTRVA
jgi:hypothetical protein